MEIVKTFVKVAIAAGVGAFAGEKAYGLVEKRLPAKVGATARSGMKLGFQAGGAVVTFGIVNSIF